jgi:hypothetical protein
MNPDDEPYALVEEAKSRSAAAPARGSAAAPARGSAAAPARERALIDALSTRYSSRADRSVNDQAYANAMRQVHERFPDDPDISMLYVESVMDIRPWRYWMLDGEPHVHEPPRG